MMHGVECNYQPPSSGGGGGGLHKPRIGIVPDPFMVKVVWLRESICSLHFTEDSYHEAGRKENKDGKKE